MYIIVIHNLILNFSFTFFIYIQLDVFTNLYYSNNWGNFETFLHNLLIWVLNYKIPEETPKL